MITIKAHGAADAWLQTTMHLLSSGEKVGPLLETLNVSIEIEEFREDEKFDKLFRIVFGDERIDYASSVTFIQPKQSPITKNLVYSPIGSPSPASWKDSYFGRMCNYYGRFNQIENAIAILKQKKSVKRCEMIIYDPLLDARNMYKQPCLLAIDLKPRNEFLYLTAFFRSQRVSKSGYADYSALIQLGKFLAAQSGNVLKLVTCIAASCHVTTENSELKKSKRLLDLIEGKSK